MYTHKLHVHKGVYILYTASFLDPEITDYKHSFLPSTKLVLLLRQGTSSLPLFPRTRSHVQGLGVLETGLLRGGRAPSGRSGGRESPAPQRGSVGTVHRNPLAVTHLSAAAQVNAGIRNTEPTLHVGLQLLIQYYFGAQLERSWPFPVATSRIQSLDVPQVRPF